MRRAESQTTGGPDAAARVDPNWVARLWRANRRWLAAVVYAHKPHDADVEDILQEVAIKLMRYGPGVDDPAAMRPWLRTVAINLARSAGRSTRARKRVDAHLRNGQVHELSDGDGSISARGGEPESVARGRRALKIASSLPPHYREPLLLSLRGLSQKQIAAVLEVPVTTIETRLIRARRMVRDELEAFEQQSSHLSIADGGEPVRASSTVSAPRSEQQVTP